MAKKKTKIAGLNLEELPGQYGRVTTSVVDSLFGKEQQIQLAYRRLAAKSFMDFTRGLRIASVFGPRLFDRCMAQFQMDLFEDIAPSLHQLREGDMPSKRRWWLERTKKASKDADLAVIMTWLLAYPVRPFYMQVAAANKEQAAIVKERMTHLLHYNSWLTEHIEIIQSTARSKKLNAAGQPLATLHIMSSDSEGAHGGTPDLLVLNELSHVKNFEFAETLLDNADGVAQGMVVIATNAGFTNTPAYRWKLNAIQSPDWEVHQLSKPAPWHSKKTLDDARQRNSPSRFLRLWQGKWVSTAGDKISEEAIAAAFCLKGPLFERESGWDYIGGLDLGVSNDHSGFVVLAVNYKLQKVKLVHMKRWVPPTGGDIYLPDVEEECLKMAKLFGLRYLFYDPHQAVLMAQRLSKAGVIMRPMTFSSPRNLTLMATSYMQLLEARKIQLYDDEEGTLRADFDKLKVVDRASGYKLEAVSDESGHADLGTALVIALPAVMDLLGLGNQFLSPEDTIAGTQDVELTEEELEAMPQELREICDMEDQMVIEARLEEQADAFADIS
jgi:hypothetical protein